MIGLVRYWYDYVQFCLHMNSFAWIQFGFVSIMKFFMCSDGIPCISISVIFTQVLWGGRWQSGAAATTGEEVEHINSHFSRLGSSTKHMLPEGTSPNFPSTKWCQQLEDAKCMFCYKLLLAKVQGDTPQGLFPVQFTTLYPRNQNSMITAILKKVENAVLAKVSYKNFS